MGGRYVTSLGIEIPPKTIMKDLRGYSEEKRVNVLRLKGKDPSVLSVVITRRVRMQCCSAGVSNRKHFYRQYRCEEILMAKKLI